MGILPRVKVWEPGVHYEDDVVTTGGATYQATKDTAQEPGVGKDWICIARAGADGDDGLSPDVRGLFDAAATYRRLSIVAVNGSSFIAKKDDPGPCPGAGWQLLVSQGKRGDKGERGMQGPPGTPAPLIVKWHVDPENFIAVPITSDGREGEPLPMRAFFEQFHREAR